MRDYVAVTGLLASSLGSMQAFSVEREGAAKDAGDVKDVRNQLVVRKAL